MTYYQEVCGDVLSIMATLCNKSDEWKEEKYCEYSCQENGNGYVGSFCCKPSEYPSAKPSSIPIDPI